MVASGAELLRSVHASQRFSLWGEDGSTFLQQVHAQGILRSFFTTHAGYFHLLPRTFAAIFSTMPLPWSPVLFACAAAAVAASAALISYRCCTGVGVSPLMAALVATTVLLLPASGPEVVDVLTNVQWYCEAGVAVFVVALLGGYAPRPAPTATLLLIAGLTSPLVGLLLPFVAIAAAARRRRVDAVALVAVAVTAVAQLFGRAVSHLGGGLAFHPLLTVRMYSVRVVDGAMVGDRFINEIYRLVSPLGAELLGAVAFVCVVVAASRVPDPRVRSVMVSALALSVYLLAAATVLRPPLDSSAHLGGLVAIAGSSRTANGRYMGTPAACLILAVAACLSHTHRRLPSDAVNWQAVNWRAIIVAPIVLMLAVNFPVDLYRFSLGNWEAQIRAARVLCRSHPATAAVRAYNAPAPPFVWHIRLTCRQAFGR